MSVPVDLSAGPVRQLEGTGGNRKVDTSALYNLISFSRRNVDDLGVISVL